MIQFLVVHKQDLHCSFSVCPHNKRKDTKNRPWLSVFLLNSDNSWDEQIATSREISLMSEFSLKRVKGNTWSIAWAKNNKSIVFKQYICCSLEFAFFPLLAFTESNKPLVLLKSSSFHFHWVIFNRCAIFFSLSD